MTSSHVRVVGGLLLACVCVVLYLVAGCGASKDADPSIQVHLPYWVYSTSDAFDVERWKSSKSTPIAQRNHPRGSMVKDLIESKLRKGGTRQNIEALLGAADQAMARGTESVWMYRLGMWSGFHMDVDVLEIGFGSDGKMSSIAVVQH